MRLIKNYLIVIWHIIIVIWHFVLNFFVSTFVLNNLKVISGVQVTWITLYIWVSVYIYIWYTTTIGHFILFHFSFFAPWMFSQFYVVPRKEKCNNTGRVTNFFILQLQERLHKTVLFFIVAFETIRGKRLSVKKLAARNMEEMLLRQWDARTVLCIHVRV